MKINWHQESGDFLFLFFYLFIFVRHIWYFCCLARRYLPKVKQKIITGGFMRHLFVYEQSVDVNWSVEKGPLRYSAQGHKVQSHVL